MIPLTLGIYSFRQHGFYVTGKIMQPAPCLVVALPVPFLSYALYQSKGFNEGVVHLWRKRENQFAVVLLFHRSGFPFKPRCYEQKELIARLVPFCQAFLHVPRIPLNRQAIYMRNTKPYTKFILVIVLIFYLTT